jgi:hypothetical protein
MKFGYNLPSLIYAKIFWLTVNQGRCVRSSKVKGCYMLPVFPLDIFSIILYGLDMRFIAKLRLVNRAYRNKVNDLLNNNNFLVSRLIQILRTISDNTADLVSVDELKLVPIECLKDLLILLYLVEHPNRNNTTRVNYFIDRIRAHSLFSTSLNNIYMIIKIRLYGNPILGDFQNPRTIEKGLTLSQQWHVASPCSASLFALATFWRLYAVTTAEQEKIRMQNNKDDYPSIVPEDARDNYVIYIKKALSNIDESFYTQISHNPHLLSAFANIHSNRILEAIKNRDTVCTYHSLLLLNPENIAFVCAVGSVSKLEAQVAAAIVTPPILPPLKDLEGMAKESLLSQESERAGKARVNA